MDLSRKQISKDLCNVLLHTMHPIGNTGIHSRGIPHTVLVNQGKEIIFSYARQLGKSISYTDTLPMNVRYSLENTVRRIKDDGCSKNSNPISPILVRGSIRKIIEDKPMIAINIIRRYRDVKI